MSHTEEVLNKINIESRHQLEHYRNMLIVARENGSRLTESEYVYSINGFVTCMAINRIIKESDRRVLYTFYTL